MGFFGFVNNLFGFRDGFNNIRLGDIANVPQNFRNNVNTIVQSNAANIRGDVYPISQEQLTAAGITTPVNQVFTRVGLNSTSFIVNQDITINDTSSNPPRTTQLSAGEVISMYQGDFGPDTTHPQWTGGIFGQYNPSQAWRFYGFDLNGDIDFNSFAGLDPSFSDEYGRVWVRYDRTHNTLSQISNTSQFDQANAHRLPIGLNRAAGDYVYATGDGQWTLIRKTYMGLDNINSAGRHPVTGQQLNNPYFNQQFGYNQYNQSWPGAFNQFTPGGFDPRLYYDPINNPFEWQHSIGNMANAYNTTPETSFLRVVPQNDVTGDLALLRDYLRQGYTYRDGFLNGYGAWSVDYTFQEGTPPQPVTKTITDAYLNQQGELIVEYA